MSVLTALAADDLRTLRVLAGRARDRSDSGLFADWAWAMLERGAAGPSIAALTAAPAMPVDSRLDALVDGALAEAGIPALPATEGLAERVCLLPVFLDWRAGRLTARAALERLKPHAPISVEAGYAFTLLGYALEEAEHGIHPPYHWWCAGPFDVEAIFAEETTAWLAETEAQLGDLPALIRTAPAGCDGGQTA